MLLLSIFRKLSRIDEHFHAALDDSYDEEGLDQGKQDDEWDDNTEEPPGGGLQDAGRSDHALHIKTHFDEEIGGIGLQDAHPDRGHNPTVNDSVDILNGIQDTNLVITLK